MTPGFKIGEVLVGQNFVDNPEYNGMECVVTAICGMTQRLRLPTFEMIPGFYYAVEFANGKRWDIISRNLRRKQPPTGLIAVLRMFDITAPAPREVEAA